tara:strand:+ start:441 stop:566 length:126 start_codon:yes stop_codon:yes gene_type:complete
MLFLEAKNANCAKKEKKKRRREKEENESKLEQTFKYFTKKK